MIRRASFLVLLLALFLILPKISNSQVVRPTGNATEEVSSQLIFVYGDDSAQIQVTNTNDTQVFGYMFRYSEMTIPMGLITMAMR